MKASHLYGMGLMFMLALFISDVKTALAAEPVPATEQATSPSQTEDQWHTNFIQGVKHYQIGNYEEALALLLKAAKAVPENAQVQYYLGMTLQGKLKYPEAEAALIKSTELDDSQGNTYAHLGEVRYRLGRYDEAKVALEAAESKGARPGYTQYLKGLTLMELSDYAGAIEALNKAKTQNPEYQQKATYALGMIYKKQQNKTAAEQAFKAAVAINPESAAGVFAGIGLQSMQEVKKREFRFDFGYGVHYDDNVLLKPAGGVAPGLLPANEKDFTHVFSLHADYEPELSGAFGFRADATYYKSLHHRLKLMDVDGLGVSITPSLNGDFGSLIIEGRADYYRVNQKRYLSMFSVQPKFNFPMGGMLQGILHAAYQNKQFLALEPNTAENRDATNLSAGYTQYINAKDLSAYLAVDYAYDVDRATGNNWRYHGHRLSVMGLYPFNDDFGFRFNGDFYLQNYRNVHTVYNTKRKDRIFTAAPMLTYDMDWITLLLQYTYVHSQSNIQVYRYSRNITGVGFEYSY